jgi:hypothetical protein
MRILECFVQTAHAIMSQASRCAAIAALAVGVLFGGVERASANLISWEWNGTVGGTALLQTVPAGTPMSIDFTFDSAAPNVCSSTSSGIFYVDSAQVRIGGGSYRGAGAIESSADSGTCGAGTETLLRLFVTNAAPSILGNVPLVSGDFLTLDLPDPANLGGLPLDLPGGLFASELHTGSAPSGMLRLNSVDGLLTPTAVPEPATIALLATGLGLAASRRRNG